MGYFEDKLLEWAALNHLFDGVNKVLLAVSGGADSVAMAHGLAHLNRAGKLCCGFVVAHINHCLRGADSDADEAFVKELANQLAIPVVTTSADVSGYAKTHKLSIETAGRTLRLEALAAMADENGCGVIATAHHADDQAETLVHRLMRGTGFRGLCGIKPISTIKGAVYVRPMLNLRRSEIIHYCKDNDIQWRHDESNNDPAFTRNRIRHRLLPALKNDSASLADLLMNLSRAACRFSAEAEKQAQDLLDRAMVENRPDCLSLEKDPLRKCPPWVFYELTRKVLMGLNTSLRKYTQEHFTTIYRLMDQSQATISMPDGIQVFTKKKRLGFCRDTAILPLEPIQLEIGQTTRFGCWDISARVINTDPVDFSRFLNTKSPYVEWFDADRIVGRIEIRQRQNGDRFWPIGAGNSKKVGRFLMDAGLDAEAKRQAFIIQDAEKILWLAPIRMSEQVRVTETTTKMIEIQIMLCAGKAVKCLS